MGEKDPIDDKDVSHSICKDCLSISDKQREFLEKNGKIPNALFLPAQKFLHNPDRTSDVFGLKIYRTNCNEMMVGLI